MTFLNDLTLQQIVTRGLAYFIFAGVHGGILALVLRAGTEGRAGLRPPVLPRISVWGLFMAVLFRAGWVRPPEVPLSAGRLRMVLAVLAASAGTLALIPLADLLRPLIPAGSDATAGRFAVILLGQVQEVFLGGAVLALLPWPAVPGRLFLAAAFPPVVRRLERWEGPATLVLVCAMIAVFDPAWIQWAMPFLSLVR